MNRAIIEESIENILPILQLGTSIPILPQFKDLIHFSLKNYKVKAILIKENKRKDSLFKKSSIIGIAIIYNEATTLYFGFFKALNHNKNIIQKLIDEIITYAKDHNFSYIRGPINVPTILFGYGFMFSGSNTRTFIGRSVDPPIYLKQFKENGFYEQFTLDTYTLEIKKLYFESINQYENEFDFIMIGIDDILNYKDHFIKLQSENMPEHSQITPNVEINSQTILQYISNKHILDKLGWITLHLPSNTIVACGYIIPNPYDSHVISLEHVVINKQYQGKGLIKFMWARFMQYLTGLKKDKRPLYGTGFFNINNEKMISFIQKYNSAWRERRHIVLEYKL